MFGKQQCAQSDIAVAAYAPQADEFGQTLFELRAQQSGAGLDPVEKARAMAFKILFDAAGIGARLDGLLVLGLGARERLPDVEIAPHRHGDRGGLDRTAPAQPARGEAVTAPGQPAADTEQIQPLRVVVADSGRVNAAFPGGRGSGGAVEQPDAFLQLQLAVENRSRAGRFAGAQTMPLKQEFGEQFQRYRLDALAMQIDGIAMDALQQAPFAPLHRTFFGPGAGIG